MKVLIVITVVIYIVLEISMFFLRRKRSVSITFKAKLLRVLFSSVVLILLVVTLFYEKKEKCDATLITRNGKIHLILKKRFDAISHDPLSIFEDNSYLDSMTYIIPRDQGIVKGQEILKETGYPMIGYIKISSSEIDVKLLNNNYDDHVIEESRWNGEYSLLRK